MPKFVLINWSVPSVDLEQESVQKEYFPAVAEEEVDDDSCGRQKEPGVTEGGRTYHGDYLELVRGGDFKVKPLCEVLEK